jgi:argininosuccinate lyase
MASRPSRRRFGHYLAAAIEVMLRDHQRLAQARELIDLCAAGRRRDHDLRLPARPAPRRAAARLQAAPLQNSYGCIAAVDYVTASYGAVELVFLHLGRLIQDLQFWTAFEVGQALCPQRLRADLLDHAAEAQSGADRASAPSGVSERRRARHGPRHRPQHALH